MRISFDLDDTLICYQPGSLYEPTRVPLLLRHWFDEPLRLGAVSMMHQLSVLGCELGIYTTSLRSPTHLRRWFAFYGIKIAFVVNEAIHQTAIEPHRFQPRPSKYPPAFKIDLHIDDSSGVQTEGRSHGFSVIVVDPADELWHEKVLNEVKRRL